MFWTVSVAVILHLRGPRSGLQDHGSEVLPLAANVNNAEYCADRYGPRVVATRGEVAAVPTDPWPRARVAHECLRPSDSRSRAGPGGTPSGVWSYEDACLAEIHWEITRA